jgi:D-3-phosphoglycerate dehydrogenase
MPTSSTVVFTGPEGALEAVTRVLPDGWQARRVEPEPEAVAAGLRDCAVFIDASMKVRITEAMIAAAPALRVVSTATTGADHIAGGALQARGIPLLTLATEKAFLRQLTPAAELSWLLVMACARQLRPAIQHVLDGHWQRSDFPGLMLKGRVLGVIGCGRIGQFMATYARAFGMHVVGYDPHLDVWPDTIERVDRLDVARRADIVSIHVPLNDQTRGLVDAEFLAHCRRGVIVVNTSRGEIADEAALLAGLESGQIGAVGLDVLVGEPEIDRHPLVTYARSHANVVITPHIGGFSPDAVGLAVEHATRRAVDALTGHV